MTGPEIEKLSDKLVFSSFRKKLTQGNVPEVLRQEGIDPAKLPPGFVATIGMLTEEELNTIATVNLKAAAAEKAGGIEGGILF